MPFPFELGAAVLPLPFALLAWSFLALPSARISGRPVGLADRHIAADKQQVTLNIPEILAQAFGEGSGTGGQRQRRRHADSLRITHLDADAEENDGGSEPLAGRKLVVEQDDTQLEMASPSSRGIVSFEACRRREWPGD